MLAVKAIDTFYEEAHILHGVSLRVEKGETVSLLGRNGAGKTTLLKTITGLLSWSRRGRRSGLAGKEGTFSPISLRT